MGNCYRVMLSPSIASLVREHFLVILQKKEEAQEAGAMH